MSVYAVVIFSVIILNFALDAVLDILNVRAMRPDLPEEFAGAYPPEKYAASQRYLKENTVFGLFSATAGILVLFLFIYAGTFNAADGIARSAGFGEIGSGLLFFFILMAAFEVIQIPKAAYATFVIEEKYGFNKTTVKTFITDIIKGAFLSIIIGGICMAALIWFFSSFGKWAWVYAWASLTVFQLGVGYISPVLIMPLFNKYEPLEPGPLRSEIETYANSQSFKLKGVFTMDGSKRSTKSNAFFTGFGRFRRIVLFDTLIAQMTAPEIVSVLAHEVGHFKKKHIIKGMAMSVASFGIMLFVFSLFIGNIKLAGVFGFENPSVYASLVAFGFLYAPVSFATGVFGAWLSRKNEYEADRFAVTTYLHGGDFIAALKKLSVENLSNLTPHPWKVMLEYSHPPVMERIAAIRKISPVQPPES
ncbi:MAG: M48 family metallopeptidase [Elusimicrobiaceae bacterium]